MIEKIKTIIRGTINMNRLKKDGLIVGKNFHAQEGVIIDPGHCWLIEIGDNVTLAPRAHILAHDASTKNILGYTKIVNVKIGNNVFIGAGSIIMPGVEIADNTIVGAGSIVTKSLSSGVYAGNPCKKIYSFDEYKLKQAEKMKHMPIYDESFVIGKVSTENKSRMMAEIKISKGGFII